MRLSVQFFTFREGTPNLRDGREMCARQVSGLFETRRVFIERSCNGGADSKRAGSQDSGQLLKHALIEF